MEKTAATREYSISHNDYGFFSSKPYTQHTTAFIVYFFLKYEDRNRKEIKKA
jgi:hypothetical protein